MKIVSWNVNGIRACAKKGFLEYIKREQPDILCLQETKAHPEQLTEDLLQPEGRHGYFSSAVKKGYSGTATFLKNDARAVRHGIGIKKFDSEGRFVITEHKEFDLYNIYFPNGAASQERHDYKQDFLKRLTRHLRKEMDVGKEIVVVGDYNVAYMDIDVFDPVRLSKVSGFLPEEREWFRAFLDQGFTDVFRHFYPEAKDQYTWWSYRERARLANRGWRIDHICVSPGLVDKLQRVEIQNQQLGSDHCPVAVELKVKE